MGAFFKSFWSQLGRSTGKRVSNAVFGDKWSTPYRVVVDESPNKPTRSHHEKNYGRRSPNRGSTKGWSRNWLSWIAGFILFAGTYNAILHPTKEDVVLIIMLWVVAIIFILYKYSRSQR